MIAAVNLRGDRLGEAEGERDLTAIMSSERVNHRRERLCSGCMAAPAAAECCGTSDKSRDAGGSPELRAEMWVTAAERSLKGKHDKLQK